MIIRSGGEGRHALRWIIADALAPVLKVCSTFFYSILKEALGIVLSVFCGCFIYIGANNLLPESHDAQPKTFTTLMTLLGMAILYAVIQIAG
jgi:ZIP family zinc transporter